MLGCYVLALAPWGMSSFVQKAFYGAREVRIPTLLIAFAAIVNVALDYLLLVVFGPLGIPFAFVLTSLVSLVASMWLLWKSLHLKLSSDTMQFLARAVVGGTLSYGLLRVTTDWMEVGSASSAGWLVLGLKILLTCVIGAATYSAFIFLASLCSTRRTGSRLPA